MRVVDPVEISFSSPGDVLRDDGLDTVSKRLILRQWQHAAVKTINPCEDPVSGPLLAGIRDALDELDDRQP
jgi:hypothetical protein